MTDAEILSLFMQRDEQAIAETQKQYGSLAASLARRILGDRLDTEECVSDVLYRLWDSIPPVYPKSLPAYISALTRRTALDRRDKSHAAKRGGGRAAAALDDIAPYLAAPENVEDRLTQIALQEALTRFLGSLTPDARRIFLARYWSFQTPKEIAKEHGATLGSVKMSLKRTKEKLREYLKKEGLI